MVTVLAKRGAKRQGVAAVPRIIDQSIDDAAYTGAPAGAVYELALLSRCGVAEAHVEPPSQRYLIRLHQTDRSV